MKSRIFSLNPLSVADSAKSRTTDRMSDGDALWDLMIPRIIQVNSACSIQGSLQYNLNNGSSGQVR